MRLLLTFLTLIFFSLTVKGQYPFEKYPAIKYQEYNNWKHFDKEEKEHKIHHTLTISNFFENGDSLTIQLTSFTEHYWDSSIVRIFRNQNQIQKFFVDMAFSETNVSDAVRVADINGDKLKDLKLVIPSMGCGTASMNVVVIYLFQNADNHFTEIVFGDKMIDNRPERDFDNDGNFEIITMNLVGYEKHSYFVFNLFNYKDGELINVNAKDDYPIMIQYLYRDNYEITNKISRENMKKFSMIFPDDYEKK